MHDKAVLDDVKTTYGENIGKLVDFVSKALLDNSWKGFVDLYQKVISRDLLGTHLGSRSGDGISV